MTNIAEILKDCPKGTKLYSPICGECELDSICYGDEVITVFYKAKVKSNYTTSELYDELDRNYILCFDKYGRYKTTDRSDTNGEVMLFPSKNCRDWNAMKVTQRFKKEVTAMLEGFEKFDTKPETNQKDKRITTKCGYCCNVFEYDASELEEEEDRDMRGYHYYYYTKCPKCGNRILVNALM